MAKLLEDYRRFRARDGVYGIERCFDSVLLLLRVAAPSFWLRALLPSSNGPRRYIRDNAIDAYCIFQTLLLILVLRAVEPCVASVCIAGGVLFEVVLTVGTVVFIGKFPELQAQPASVERSIILLFLNLIEVVLSFAVFYRFSLGLTASDAFFQAMLVLGTVGYPVGLTSNSQLVVALQIFLDMALVVLLLSSFVSQVGLFARRVPAQHGIDDVA